MSFLRSFSADPTTGRSAKFTPPILRFEEEAILDKVETLKSGRNIYKTTHVVKITPPDADRTTEIVKSVDKWLEEIKTNPLYIHNSFNGVPFGHLAKEMYEAWRNNQEGPVVGTPLKQWGLISKGQATTLCDSGITSVEALAEMSDVGLRQFGPSFFELRKKAVAWLESSTTNKNAVAIDALSEENAKLKDIIQTLTTRLNGLVSKVNTLDPTAELRPSTLDVTQFDVASIIEEARVDEEVKVIKKKTKKKTKKAATKKTKKVDNTNDEHSRDNEQNT